MVQVDVFWTYALGASTAVVASRQIAREQDEGKQALDSPYFIKTVLFLAVLFAPSGVCLLWAFPSWETMHVGDRNLPAWLVTGFAATNITQGILGFWVAWKLIEYRRRYAAFLQIMLGYFLMFFILVHGWDGSGYQRFFSATREDFLNWTTGNIAAWFTSDVAATLGLFAMFMLPVLFHYYSAWVREGYELADDIDPAAARGVTRGQVIGTLLLALVAGGLGAAIAASLLVRAFGWAAGGALFAAIAAFAGVRRGGLLGRIYDRLMLEGAPTPRPDVSGRASVAGRA